MAFQDWVPIVGGISGIVSLLLVLVSGFSHQSEARETVSGAECAPTAPCGPLLAYVVPGPLVA